MAEEKVSNELIYNTLREVQQDISAIKKTLSIHSGKLSSIENIMAGFHQSLHIRDVELDEHRGRIESLEQQAKDDQPNP